MLVLVTGARGAIGRHVVRQAKSQGNRVAGLGHGAWTSDGELPPIDAWVNGSVDADNLAALRRQAGTPDLIVHLAGGSLVGASITHPAEDFRRTVESAQKLLEWMRVSAPSARLVLASSAAVYGDGHAGPIPENARTAPTSPYGTHKAIVEMLAQSYARQYSLSVAILRLFSVYGPGLRKQLIWDVSNRLLAGERDVTLGGTGKEQRDFLYISDAAAMLLDASAKAGTTAPVFNGSGGSAIQISDLAAMAASHFPGVNITFSGQSRLGDPFSLVANTQAADAAGLVATVPLASGLDETFQWIRRTRTPGPTS